MAVQKFKKVENWELLETFFDCKIPAFSLIIDNVMSRTFCKCGKTYAGLRERCDCENPVTKKFDYCEVSSTAKFYYKLETDKYGNNEGEMQFFMDRLTFDLSDSSKLRFVLKTVPIVSIGKDYFIEQDVKEARYIRQLEDDFTFDDYLKANISKHPFYDCFRFWYEINVRKSTSTLECLEQVVDFKKNNPILYGDSQINQYPYLTSYFLGAYCGMHDNTLKNLYLKYIGKDEQYMDAVNYYLMKNSKNVYWSNPSTLLQRISFFYDLSDSRNQLKEKKDLLDLVKHYIFNHMLTLVEAYNILNLISSIIENPSRPRQFTYDYKYFDGWNHKKSDPIFEDFFDVSYLDFFDTYLKENISIVEDKIQIVYDFIDRIREMKESSIPIKRDNFKVKNYNWNLTNKKMAEAYKLPESKVSLFLDMFECNPLDALELIENRRKLTPKQIDSIIDKLSK